MKLTNNVSMKEAIKSTTAIKLGITNQPTEEEIAKLKITAAKIFQPIREHFAIPIGITSMFRSYKLNKALRGASSSQHMKAEAIDVDADMFGGKVKNKEGELVEFTNKMIFDFVRENLEFDQLIWEYGTKECPDWVHISYKPGANRMRVLRVFRDSKGKPQYVNG